MELWDKGDSICPEASQGVIKEQVKSELEFYTESIDQVNLQRFTERAPASTPNGVREWILEHHSFILVQLVGY